MLYRVNPIWSEAEPAARHEVNLVFRRNVRRGSAEPFQVLMLLNSAFYFPPHANLHSRVQHTKQYRGSNDPIGGVPTDYRGSNDLTGGGAATAYREASDPDAIQSLALCGFATP